jgi:DNA-binding transcriptional MerR regulator
MTEMLSVAELARTVNRWCEENRVEPASGQAGVRVTERNIRYYRTLGLVDPPDTGAGRGYGEKHRLQLVAIRLLQARGLPLSRIQQLLYGRSLEDLRRIERQGLEEWKAEAVPVFRPAADESWRMTPLSDEFLLVSRNGRTVPEAVRERILELLGNGGTNKRGGRAARLED